MMKKLCLTLLAIIMITSACEVNPVSGDIVKVISGQSFGMCVGKCYNELIVESSGVTLFQKTWGFQETNQEFRHQANERLPSIQADLVHFPTRKFLAMKDTYGCPDCADGGAEWLEVHLKNGRIKKVTFEYGATLEGLEKVTQALRSHRLAVMEKFR